MFIVIDCLFACKVIDSISWTSALVLSVFFISCQNYYLYLCNLLLHMYKHFLHLKHVFIFMFKCWILLKPVLRGVDSSLHFTVPSMNRLSQTEPATFTILSFWTFFRDFYFLYFNVFYLPFQIEYCLTISHHT
jgi:hypothetical protein